ILKNFRWLFFRLRLNNPFILSKVFLGSFFTLFNLQGTVCRPGTGQLAYIITDPAICQALFLFFSIIFSAFFKRSVFTIKRNLGYRVSEAKHEI
ncbi:MAG: hypothetical protein ACI3VZ_05300, partial [Faecousia sp.]